MLNSKIRILYRSKLDMRHSERVSIQQQHLIGQHFDSQAVTFDLSPQRAFKPKQSQLLPTEIVVA